MTGSVEMINRELDSLADPAKAAILGRFFQAFPGGYGEGDRFIGVAVPDQRKIARRYYGKVALSELELLLHDPCHERRQTALFILVLKFGKAGSDTEREALVGYYLGNTAYVNNWDLVDSSAYKILGPYLLNRDKRVLYDLAATGTLWEQRIAVIATLHFIRAGSFEDTFALADVLLEHPHDLIHKAVGWMLREIGKRDFEAEFAYLESRYRRMPRTMLRYAIEKFEPGLRRKFLAGEI